MMPSLPPFLNFPRARAPHPIDLRAQKARYRSIGFARLLYALKRSEHVINMNVKAEFVLIVYVVVFVSVTFLVFGSSAETVVRQLWFWAVLVVPGAVAYFFMQTSPAKPKVQWPEGESVMGQFHGGRSFHVGEDIATADDDVPIAGTWFVTNRRLLFARRVDDVARSGETFQYDLRKLTGVTSRDEKYVVFTLLERGGSREVRIRTEQAGDFKETLQKAIGSTSTNKAETDREPS